jgi:hypothetical protein
LAFTLSGDGKRKIKYSPRERAIFMLLPQNGKSINTHSLIDRYYKKKAPVNARMCIIGAMRSLISKVQRNREPFRIKKSDRSGPHPMEFWVEKP